MYASVALMARGASVYKNTGCDGKTDLCFKYKGNVYEIDVKLARYMHDGKGRFSWRANQAAKVKLPVYPLIVVPLTGPDLSGWFCRWHSKKRGSKSFLNCPSGLENFWN